MKRDSPGGEKVSRSDDIAQGHGGASPKAVVDGMQAPASLAADGLQPPRSLSALQHSHSIFDGATVTWTNDV